MAFFSNIPFFRSGGGGGHNNSSSSSNRANEFILIRTYSFARLGRYLHKLVLFLYRFSAFHFSSFFLHVVYFGGLVLLGSLLMSVLPPSNPDYNPRYVDMFFMSTSALTVSGLGTVVMEDLSSPQVIVLALLMLVGGEAFVTLLGLLLQRIKPPAAQGGQVAGEESDDQNDVAVDIVVADNHDVVTHREAAAAKEEEHLASLCVRRMGNILMAYIFVFHVFGIVSLVIYFKCVSDARQILAAKGIDTFLFAFSSTASSFANGGIIATNENMAIFNRNPTVLLLMIAQVLAGNTLLPLFLRWTVSALRRLTKKQDLDRMLKADAVVVEPLLPAAETRRVSLTVVGLLTALLGLFLAMDWNGAVFAGQTPFEKFSSAFFIAANSRHAGENSIDPSLISPAVLVFIIVMMYLPSSMTFTPIHDDEDEKKTNKEKKKKTMKKKSSSWIAHLIFSQLSYIIIFIMAICIIERKKLSRDPLNFSTLNIIFEVMSGYGNVGLSTGYSCARLQKIHPEAVCADKPYSLSGKWSDGGKLILCFVMLYGRLKKFSANGGKAWKLY
ncbi:cation transporter HKT2-like [Zingiber officinale]|uniref:cation transporter HKT2-like n=1 Tax=Zingiber officinale TaxID=94328 RepID=UPI001C4D6D4C|nr:cation transporter HKT2-like [Zingiber officinale]